MEVNPLRAAVLLLIGTQVITIICLYALLNRVNKLESTHNEEGHQKEKYIYKRGEE